MQFTRVNYVVVQKIVYGVLQNDKCVGSNILDFP